MKIILLLSCGFLLGFGIKQVVNWLGVDGFFIKKSNLLLEIISSVSVLWAFEHLLFPESLIFSIIVALLTGIAIVDYNTFEIPLILIIVGILTIILGIFTDIIAFVSALWGIFVGAIIPLALIGILWVITKRQGMGFGDIQLGFVLGAWLGPMRMALTLFLASVLSLIVWIAVSLVHGFDKNRAIPMGPFLSVAGTGIYVGSFYYPELFHLLII